MVGRDVRATVTGPNTTGAGGRVAEESMRPRNVRETPAALHDHPGFPVRAGDFAFEEFVAKAGIERLDETVLHGARGPTYAVPASTALIHSRTASATNSGDLS